MDVVRKMITAPGIDIGAVNKYGKTAIMLAAEFGHKAVFNTILGMEENDLDPVDLQELMLRIVRLQPKRAVNDGNLISIQAINTQQMNTNTIFQRMISKLLGIENMGEAATKVKENVSGWLDNASTSTSGVLPFAKQISTRTENDGHAVTIYAEKDPKQRDKILVTILNRGGDPQNKHDIPRSNKRNAAYTVKMNPDKFQKFKNKFLGDTQESLDNLYTDLGEGNASMPMARQKTGSCSSQGLDMLIRFALIKMENQSAKQQYQQIRIVELQETVQQIDEQLNAIAAIDEQLMSSTVPSKLTIAQQRARKEFMQDLQLFKRGSKPNRSSASKSMPKKRKLKDKYIVDK